MLSSCFAEMGFLVFLVLIAVSASQTTVVSAGDAGVLASSPLAGWAIALLVVSSILCALGVALIVIGMLCPRRTSSSLAASDADEGSSANKHVRGELVVAGSVLAILALICLATTLAIALSPTSVPFRPGVEVVVVSVYAQPVSGSGATQLMADVRLPDGSLRSVLVKGVLASPGQRGYIAQDGTLVVYSGYAYSYGWYGYYGGGWAAIFFIWLFCSLLFMCVCMAHEPEVRYVEVRGDESYTRRETPKEKPLAKESSDVPLHTES